MPMWKAGLADELCDEIWIRPARHQAAIESELAVRLTAAFPSRREASA